MDKITRGKTRSRTVSAKEKALWEQVMSNVQPSTKRRSAEPSVNILPTRPKRTVAKPLPPAPGIAFTTEHSGVDGKTHARLRKGKLQPEAILDLHGMDCARAFSQIKRFITANYRQGTRRLLIITGKGRRSSALAPAIDTEVRGILHRQVPMWLTNSDIAPMIATSMPAHRSQGGDGAIFVYLRRIR